ncbi:MAG TPA: stage II sporulation protein M, partial [Cytophagales bacterium]|nr:stage II sporulation protein M [Cytophagales bacterium]
MKETRFIAQNKEKWHEAEELLNSPVKDPEKLANLFVQVVDDLSYSRTYYPNRSVRVYLNKIARIYFSLIYSQKKEKRGLFKFFWLDELPQVILFCKKELIISLIVFLAAVSIGVFSSMNDPQFANSILGDSYIKMTEKNIASGDPMAVYKESQQVTMFLGITLNNLMVAFRTYVLGIFIGIGTLASLVSNGVMVGCFQYYFLERGLFIESASSIWLHGTLEISSIILAGGAGLTLGRGLIFPGTYSRLQSLQVSGMRSLKLMLGITPVFVVAAIIESFLTRYTHAPVIVKLILIVLSAAFIVGYLIIYPWMKSKKRFEAPLKETKLPPSNTEPTQFHNIKSNSDVLKDTFRFYSRHSSRIVPLVLGVAAAVSGLSLFLDEEPTIFFANLWWQSFFSDMFYALHTPTWPFIIINSVALTIILYLLMVLVEKEYR